VEVSIKIMRNISLPHLKFSEWYEWKNRNEYPLKTSPGVYLLSITPKSDLAGKEPSFEDVVYIGMTNSRLGLCGRWNQFFNSVSGKGGHSGGMRVFLDKGHYDTWKDYFYVAAMGVECNVRNPTDEDYLKMGWVTYLEYEAFALYYRNVGGHPKYNKR
jgi:hypothetical protein